MSVINLKIVIRRTISNRRFLICLILLSLPGFSFAQSSDKLINDGNGLYMQKKYNEAEIKYRKSLQSNDKPFIGNYNLGNTYYQQGKYDEAKQQYEIAAGTKSVSKEDLSKAYHNLGNAYVKNKKYEESIQAYKESLKINPKDNDTRYNLAYAKAMLQQQQQQQQQQNDKNKQDDKKDKNKQDKNQKQNDDKKKQDQEKEQQKEDQAKQDQQKQEQVKKDKISKEDAEKILQALNNDEKKTQKKLNVKEQTRVAIEKEW